VSRSLSHPRDRSRVYLVALHDDGQPPRAHVFAFARHGTEQQIEEELRQLTALAPWRDPVSLPLNRHCTVKPPSEVFLARALARQRWFLAGALESFRRRWARFGLPLGNFNRPEATWFRDPPAFPPEEGALWRSGHSVFVVNLDEHRFVQAMALAWQALPVGLRPVWGYEVAIDQGRGFEYAGASGTFGSFHSAAESRKRWRAERAAAREGLVPGVIGVHAGRRRFLLEELTERAAKSRTSPDEEWRAEVRVCFDVVLAECVTEFLQQLAATARSHPDDPFSAVKRAWPRAYESLLTALRRGLVDFALGSVLPGPRRAYETSREEPLPSEAEGTAPITASHPSTLDSDELGRIVCDEFLEALRKRLTPAEQVAFDEELRDGDRRSLARRTGRSPQTVDVLWHRIREKAKKLRDQMENPP
jgi:hypothetical protein